MLPLDVIKRRIIVHNSTQDEYDTTQTTSPATIIWCGSKLVVRVNCFQDIIAGQL